MKRAFLAELPLDTLYECAFSGLVSVSIRVFDIIRFDDADIARLAAAWPHLRTLSLCDAGEMVPACTLASLMSLARGCPDLEKLALAIDATELPRDHLEGSTLARSPCRLRKLDVLRAPIGSEPERVASLLTRYFPFLEPLDVEAKLQWDSELPFQQDSQRRERWAEVKRLMPAFLEARKTGIYGRVANRA
ncbi:hypothetical protein BD626DRAFT_478156 [Schizophyllum amplum]|uniref:F-box domain-containing protein n=1 Tax=Schizophyllum amplum TaxID=97359 RepID=A0A550D0S4_9AGAR|nr:hypothetical protein BD626DRAFT_478156 [Auriculariopsis ampla]